MKAVMGNVCEDFAGKILGTGYMRFESPIGIDGLAKESGGRLDLLAVDTRTPGCGKFREFIKQCKANYTSIYVWEIWNPWLESVLIRYGFSPCQEMQPWDEIITGVVWRTPPPVGDKE